MKVEQDFYHTSIAVGNEIDAYTAVSDFNTLGVDLTNFDGKWSIQVTRSASDGAPYVTIQCSNDNSDWRNYDPASTSISVPEIFFDDEFTFKFMRVQYFAGGGTGTVTMKLYK